MTQYTGITMCLTVPMYSCQCQPGWKGALCTETVSVCDPEHTPPPLCAHGSTCIPLPNGYTCQCPLGTAGSHCETGCNTEPIHPFFFSLTTLFIGIVFLPFFTLQQIRKPHVFHLYFLRLTQEKFVHSASFVFEMFHKAQIAIYIFIQTPSL